jgi:hypothetical protein
MVNIDLNKNSVLVLNSCWQPIGVISVKKALIAINSTSQDDGFAAKSIDIKYEKNDDGTLNLEKVESFSPCTFEEWLMVEIRDGLDQYISTPKMKIRCPSIIVTNYSKMPMRKFRVNKKILYELQKGVCGYSGKKIGIKQGSVEHKQAKSFGGKNTFENLMFVDAKINSQRGNRSLTEAGLTPLFHHKEPKPIPVCYTIKDIKHIDWKWFLEN